MSPSVVLFLGLLSVLVLERLVELRIAKQNEGKLFADGAVEFGEKHYAIVIVLHVCFFVSVVLEFLLHPHSIPAYSLFAFALFLLTQILRLWVMLTLRSRWTARIIVLKGESLVRSGPYRFLRHPNYLVVALEILSFPLIFGLWVTALVFTILNGIVLGYFRIPVENKALEWTTIEPERSQSRTL